MPGFHHSVAIVLLSFRHCRFTIPSCRCTVAVLPFHSYRCRIHRDEVIRTLIGCPPTEERQKIGFDPTATERQLRHNGRWKRQRRNGFFHASNEILTEFM